MSESAHLGDQKEGLSLLIKETVTFIQKEVECEVAVGIQRAIISYLTLFLHKIAEMEPLFKVSELIQAGSFREGTKILKPDEYDFLAVIEDLSKPNCISINRDPGKVHGKTNLPNGGFVTVSIKDEAMQEKWNSYIDHGHLQCFQNSYQRVRFGNLFIKVIKNLYKNHATPKRDGNFITCSTTEIDFINFALCLPPVNGISLKLRRVEFRTPNVLLDFQYGDQAVSVDLSPAIRYYTIEDCFSASECLSPVFTELILKNKSLLLVANRNHDFRVTVTEAEIEYIRTVMKQEHKVIYIFLKYVINLFTSKISGWDPISSYMLKNTCWAHDINCKEENRTIRVCLEQVIEELCEYCTKTVLPSVVNSTIDLFKYDKNAEEFKLKDYMMYVLKEVAQVTGITSVEDFLKYLDELVSQTVTRFNKMRGHKCVFTDDY